MNGAHDVGGMQSFGPVEPEADEPVFHADWERRAMALTLAMAPPGGWTIDTSRHTRESLPPALYYGSSYYEIWLAALERLMVENGLVTQAEIEAGAQLTPPLPDRRVLRAEDVTRVLAKGSPYQRPVAAPPRFAVGDAVRAKNMHPRGHTRLPRYARGRLGEIVDAHGGHVFPDTNAHGLGENPQWLYSVRFSSRELWGADGSTDDEVRLDLWEPYLDPA